MTDLEKIEAQHRPYHMHGEKFCECGEGGNRHPCDVVKLARALEIARLAFISLGLSGDAKYAERALKEVAS